MSTAYTKLISRDVTNVLSLSAAKEHLRILAADTAQDTLITACLNSAIKWAETRTERIYASTVYEIRIPASEATIVLPYPDFIEITKVEAMTASGTRSNLFVKTPASGTLSDYITVDDWLNPAEITVLEDNLPSDAVHLIITASFGLGAETPEDVQNAIKMLTTHFYDNPREVEVGRTANQVPMGADMILSMHHFKRFG